MTAEKPFAPGLEASGVVFNVQKFSLHDGQGLRTLVFFKGCPLRCQWCSNPESQSPWPELAVNPALCLGPRACGRCLSICPAGAIAEREGAIAFNRGQCAQCLACAKECPTGARFVYGRRLTVLEIVQKVEEDSVFYQRSGGGLTISGGEALGQPAFALELLKEAKKRRLNVALETSGAYGFETLAQAALYVDELFYDLKHWDEAAHLKGVGLGNREIVATLRRLAREFPQKKIVARVPVVPGFNDSLSDLKRIKALAPVNKDGQAAVEFLPYHRLGEIKYAFLGRPYPYKGVRPDQAKFESLKDELVG